MQVTKETKCLGTKNNMASAKKIQEKDSYKFAPLSDRELEWFDTHKCQTGKTQCANSRRLFVFFFFDLMRYIHLLNLLKKCLWKHGQWLLSTFKSL